jgi:hypothetical protein
LLIHSTFVNLCPVLSTITSKIQSIHHNSTSTLQRALDLIFQLVNEQNVVVLTTELLNYLVVAQVNANTNTIISFFFFLNVDIRVV